MDIIGAYMLDFNTIQVNFMNFSHIDQNKFKILNGSNSLEINTFSISSDYITITLKTEISIKNESFLIYEDVNIKISYADLFKSDSFNARYYYKNMLGCFYSPKSTSFRVWSPPAESVYLLLYKEGTPSDIETPKRIKMNENNGLWSVDVYGDLQDLFYTYEILVYNRLNETIDPYAKACGLNGIRGAIIDLNLTNPMDWANDLSQSLQSCTDAIIYETSIRDISIHPLSNVIHKGKFTGIAEEGSMLENGVTTVLNHILELGVTHIQFMPFFDFSNDSVDELKPEGKYNWGYDPQNYNIPEGSFSTDPSNPFCRIRELKQMIQHIHRNKISIIMDVVYNHMYNFMESCLEKTFPGYYFRTDADGKVSNGSGCGNDTASENRMMQKFILDSLIYWVKEYHIDGFRFDLMGLHDINTMNLIYEELSKLKPSIILYGEGWELNTPLLPMYRATQKNAFHTPKIGFFNDIIRNAVRGSVFNLKDKGFVAGKPGLDQEIRKSVAGCINYSSAINGPYASPSQAINYVSAHDNNTLWDKLELSCPDETLENRKSMLKLSSAIVLTCQGVPFLHSGVEFCRTKYGVDNSYNAPDNINWLDWERKAQFLDIFEYHKGLIKLRKAHPAFRMKDTIQIQKHIEFLNSQQDNTIVFWIKDNANNDSWKNIIVIYNGSKDKAKVNIPLGTWNLVADKLKAGTEIIKSMYTDNIEVEGICMYILYGI